MLENSQTYIIEQGRLTNKKRWMDSWILILLIEATIDKFANYGNTYVRNVWSINSINV
jgi:hypothetical protein